MELDLYDASYPPWLWGPPATGATAGEPGVYAPADAKRPADLADLADVVADPLTAWTPGQYVPTREGSAHWDGAAWVAGIAGAGMAFAAASGPLVVGPEGYVAPLRSADRPRNLQELAQRVQLQDEAAWPRGRSLPIGTRGKVAHWNGSEWKGGASPGYTPTVPVVPPVSPTQELPVTPPAPGAAPEGVGDGPAGAGTAGESMTTGNVDTGPQFPGDEQSGDLSR